MCESRHQVHDEVEVDHVLSVLSEALQIELTDVSGELLLVDLRNEMLVVRWVAGLPLVRIGLTYELKDERARQMAEIVAK